MAFPVILVDSTDGNKSDTACSGAGPASAITQTAAAAVEDTTATNIVIGVYDSSPDISGVATDGSAVLYIANATAGAVNFRKITGISQAANSWLNEVDATAGLAVITMDAGRTGLFVNGNVLLIRDGTNEEYVTITADNGDGTYNTRANIINNFSNADTYLMQYITVETAFTGIVAQTKYDYAIGGVRATIGGTISRKLFNNNTAAGDWKPGWTVQMQSGHAETLTAELAIYQGGDSTNGSVSIIGQSGAATRPKITFTHATQNCFIPRGSTAVRVKYADFDIERNVNGAAAAAAIANSTATGGTYYIVRNMKITSIGTSKWVNGILGSASTDIAEENYIEHTTGVAINGSNAVGNFMTDCASGVNITNQGDQPVMFNIIVNPTSTGIFIGNNSSNKQIMFNTIYANAGSPNGISIDSTLLFQTYIANNIITGMSTAIVITGSVTQAVLLSQGNLWRNNCLYSNTNQITTGYSGLLTGTITTDPTFTNASGNDFSVGTNMKALGWPNTNIGYSSTRSYIDIGAAQRQEAGQSSHVF